MLRMKTVWPGLLCCALVLFLAACAGQPAAAPADEAGGETEAEAAAAPESESEESESDEDVAAGPAGSSYINQCSAEPTQGGEITFAWADGAMSGRNWLTRGSTNESFIFSQLVDLSIEDGQSIVPDVAESWEISDDALTYTYHLRDDVVFHDGEQLTAEDVKWTIEMYTHPDAGVTMGNVLPLDAIAGYEEWVAGEADELTGVAVVDEYTVEITLSGPRADFFYGMGGMALMPEHIWSDIPFAEMIDSPYAREEAIGSGPFMITEFEPDQFYILEAHEEYYKGRPYLDQLIFRIGLTSVASWLPGLESGEIQVGDVVNGLDRERVEENEDLTVVGAPLPGAMTIWPNHQNFPDKRVLQALLYAIDRQAIVDGIYGEGQAFVYDYDNIDSDHSWISPDLDDYSYDPEMARQLLEEAGWDESQELEFLTYYQTELDRNITAAMQQYWAEVGVQVNISHMDAPSWAARVYEDPDYDLAYGCCGISVPFEYSRYSCDNVPPDGLNVSSYCNEEVDDLVDQAMVEPDEETQLELWHEISEITNEEVLHLTLFQQDRAHAVNENVCNYQFRQWSNIFWPERNPHTWYLAE